MFEKKPIRYLSAEKLMEDDFGQPFTHQEGEFVYDAATISGPWATMTEQSWKIFGASTVLGLGRGQKYRRDAEGKLWKVEG
jgi:hypothetical protein